MLILNEIDTILDTIILGDEELKAVYEPTPGTKPRQHLSISQHHTIKFLQYYNIKQCRAHVFPI